MRGAAAAMRQVVTAAGLVLAAAGCDSEGGELRDATRARELAAAMGDSAGGDSVPPPIAMDTADPQIPVFTDPSLGADQAAPPAAPAADTLPPAGPGTPPPAAVGDPALPQDWGAGVRQVRRSGAAPARVTGVRTARNEAWDRVTIEFDGPRVPSYRVAYVDRPPSQCGSGDPSEVAGERWLAITLTGAAAHDDAGRATVTERERRLSLPVMRELEFTCDFEGEVSMAIGVAQANRYRVIELANPTRLAVDVLHQ